jgi:hypothetical protein
MPNRPYICSAKSGNAAPSEKRRSPFAAMALAPVVAW